MDVQAEAAERMIRSLLAEPTTHEVLSWLRGRDAGEERTLGTFRTTEESLAFASKLYAAGARRVWAVEIRKRIRPSMEGDERRQNAGKLVIELPSEPEARKRVFDAEREIARAIGLDGTVDRGQSHIFTMLD